MNLSNAKGSTALHEAVAGGSEALVALLLQHGALRHLRNEHGCSPADCAQPVSAAPGGQSSTAELPPALIQGGVNTDMPVHCTAHKRFRCLWNRLCS